MQGIQIQEGVIKNIYVNFPHSGKIEKVWIDIPVNMQKIQKNNQQSKIYLNNNSIEIVYTWEDYKNQKEIYEIKKVR